jgi:hypothetical protein
MHHRAETPQHSNPFTTPVLKSKWLSTLVAGFGVMLVSMPTYAQTTSTVAGSSWITATIVSVSSVLALWIAAVVLSGLARKLRWVSPHRHSRLTRGVQVVFGGLLLLAMMMPYLAMNHPLVAAGLVGTGLLMTIMVGSRNRQFSRESS